MCEKDLAPGEGEVYEDVCDSCLEAMQMKYPKSKKLNARLKCHKEQAKKLKQ